MQASAITPLMGAWRARSAKALLLPAALIVEVVEEDLEEEGDLDQVDPKWPNHLPLTTSMGNMGGAFQGPQGYPTTPIYISQRLVPDSGVRLLCVETAGGRGRVGSSPHTALDCTRPSKIKPALLSASHNPQGGDDLDRPVTSVWSLLFLPKPCVCGDGGGGSGTL